MLCSLEQMFVILYDTNNTQSQRQQNNYITYTFSVQKKMASKPEVYSYCSQNFLLIVMVFVVTLNLRSKLQLSHLNKAVQTRFCSFIKYV